MRVFFHSCAWFWHSCEWFSLLRVILTRYVLNYFITTREPKLQAHAFGCLKELSPACVLNQDSAINSRLNSPYHTVCRFIRLHEHSTRMRAGSTRMRVPNLYFNMINIFSLNFWIRKKTQIVPRILIIICTNHSYPFYFLWTKLI
jgi:hypothetical protein